MANRSITITAQIKSKDDVSSESVTVQQGEVEAIDVVDQSMTMPNTKAELVALYQTEAFEINNSVQAKEMEKVAKQRVGLYEHQLKRTEFFYTINPLLRPTYMVQTLKSQFIEYQQFQMARALDQRGIIDLDKNEMMWQQLHIVDDLIADIVHHMPAQQPVGWQLTSVNKNHLKLPTVGRLRDKDSIADQASLNSYVLGHFGVMSYTYDRGYFIGHVLGYLFCCYYLAHLSIAYGVTPLPETVVPDYKYASLETAKLVRLLHSVDVYCKRRIYQLAVLCARLSCYQLDKYIEKMLIAEVNEFDKKQQIEHLDALFTQGIMPEMPDTVDLKQFPGAFGDEGKS
ncbi:hypothetical protein [Psychrobacter phenylpyruvicus]|uniref:Uncharacterized protein n=1 Tax=Psychrobacter phenylpyruvicus TaxID=29432 RepID=A0A379LH65_9GAMM|nr:hypothetical protein [Psychrobacter phenylpyruvicus]SUD89930.1 Uncharacterised protein [Psychrobacter phenylpyruvicus]